MGSNTSIELKPYNYKSNIKDYGYGKGNIVINNYNISDLIYILGYQCISEDLKFKIVTILTSYGFTSYNPEKYQDIYFIDMDEEKLLYINNTSGIITDNMLIVTVQLR